MDTAGSVQTGALRLRVRNAPGLASGLWLGEGPVAEGGHEPSGPDEEGENQPRPWCVFSKLLGPGAPVVLVLPVGERD